MTKQLPPTSEVTQGELDAARDDDALVEIGEVGRAKVRGPTGLCFMLGLDVRPTTRFLETIADAISKPKRKRKPRLKSKPKV